MLQHAADPTASFPVPVPAAVTCASLLDDYAGQRIEFRVARLARMFRLDEHEADDLRQDMYLELAKAVRRFDRALSTPHTFVNRTLDMFYRYTVRTMRCRQRQAARNPALLSTLAPEALLNGAFDQCIPDETPRTDFRLDLDTVLASIPGRLRRVCEALKVAAPREAAVQLGVHRSTIYRAIGELRALLSASGLDPCA